MDKSMDINPESIKKSVQEAYEMIMSDPKLKHVKTQLAGMVLASQTLMGNTQAAFADVTGVDPA